MLGTSDSAEMIAAALITVGVVYIIFQFALYQTTLSQRIKRNGFYRCPRYKHSEALFGSDFQTKVAEATTQGRRLVWFRETFARLGRNFEINQWGTRVFHTCDAAIIRQVLFTQFDHFGVRPSRQSSLPWLGDGVFTTDGPAWQASRALLKPIFSKIHICDMDRLDKHISRVMDEIARADYQVDLQSLFLKMYLDYSIDLLFGDDVQTTTGHSSKLDADAFLTACDDCLVQVVRAQTPWLLRWLYGWTKTWSQPFRISQSFVDWYVDAALASAQDGGHEQNRRTPAFVDDLVQHAATVNRKCLRDHMLNIFFPARDTGGVAISLVIFYLARHPETYARVRAEVLHGCKDGATYDAVKNLKFTNAVINETLRLHSPSSQVGRFALENSVLPRGGGIDRDQPMWMPKGSIVIIHMHALHRDREVWGEDADEFRPERWLDSSTIAQRRAWEYSPFLGGPRVCPGQAMILAQLAYLIATFALRFREIVNRDPEETLIEEHRVLLKIRNGVLVQLIE